MRSSSINQVSDFKERSRSQIGIQQSPDKNFASPNSGLNTVNVTPVRRGGNFSVGMSLILGSHEM